MFAIVLGSASIDSLGLLVFLSQPDPSSEQAFLDAE